MLKSYFEFDRHGTNYRTEIIGGLSTFMAMAYIIFFNPAILQQAGMDFDASVMATCLASALATVIMGVWARYPIAQAPGLGLNVFFALTVVVAMGKSWNVALGCVFIAGVIFMILSAFRVREAIMDLIPPDLQAAIAVGIGLLIAMVGLWHAGLIASDPGALIKLGPIHHPAAILSIAGLVILSILVLCKIKGAILWSMLLTLGLGLLFGVIEYQGILSAPASLSPVFLKMDIMGALNPETATVILVFLFMAMFDTVGTLVGIGNQAGFMKDGKLPRASQALFSDALGSTVGAMIGTSTVTSYVESAAGISAGARTGFANLITGLMFVLMIFFLPIARMAGGGIEAGPGQLLHPVTAPALIYVGSIMMENVIRINWKDYAIALPAFLIILGISATFSIAAGLGFGFITYPIFMLIAGRGGKVHWMVYILGAVFLAYFIFLS